jgi:hypothetical protein
MANIIGYAGYLSSIYLSFIHSNFSQYQCQFTLTLEQALLGEYGNNAATFLSLGVR